MYKLIAWITPQLIRVEQMDLCADLIASHIEMNRATRLATMKQKLLQNQDMDFEDFVSPYTNKSRQGSIDSVNPMAGHSVEVELALSERQPKENENKTIQQHPVNEGSGVGSSSSSSSSSSSAEGYFFPICWFIVALGMMSAWTAMMTFLGVFKKLFGPDIFLWMNAAYYGPALPVLILNLTFGKKMDLRCGSYNGYMVRGVGCSLILGILMAMHPSMAPIGGQTWVLIESFLIGCFGGMAYGCVFSFNAIFSKTCASVFSMGMFAPGFVFMAFQLSTDFSSGPKRKIGSLSLAHIHWIIAAALSFIGVVALFLLLNHPYSKQLLTENDVALKKEAAKKEFETNNLHALSGGKSSEKKEEDIDSSMSGVAKLLGIALISIFVSIFAIVAITTYFTKIASDGLVGNAALPVTLFYVKNSTDFLGRCFTLLPLCIRNQKVLGVSVGLRFLLVPMFFIYAVALPFHSDIFLLLLVAVSGLTSGYINTCCFVVAGSYMKNPALKSSGAALMNISFQAALIVSISFGAILSFATLPTGGVVGNITNATLKL